MPVPYTNIVAQYMDTPERRILDLRQDGLPEIPLLGWQCYSKARPDLPLHSHRGCLEIHYRERGEQTFQVADRLYHVRGGELFVNQPDETHSTGGHPCGPGVMYCLLVKLPRPRHGLLGLSPEESRRLVQRFQQLPDRQFRALRDVKRLFDELLRLHDCPETFLHKSRMRLTAVMLLMHILDSADRDTRSQTSVQMAQVIQTIREHPENEFRLEELARQTHLSLARFKGRFKAETGVSPWQFILQTKIQAAQQRLRAGDRSVTDIALDLGFVSSQYFATVFKRFTGLTPRAYRRGASPQGPSIREDDGQS
jgi:AraC-like DNA-binding protein